MSSDMQDNNQNRPKGQGHHPLANYQFSPDELKVLRECNVESFYQRSLPLSIGFGVGAYFAVKNGLLKPNAKYGAVPKVVVNVIIGYFVGKFSYQTKCAEKIMKLPNSKLAEVLRQRRKGGFYESLTPDHGLGAGLALPQFSSPTDQYTDEALKSNSLNLDTERPTQSGLDDTFRPNVDTPITNFEDDLPLAPSKQTVTYDELRQKNRDEYARKQQTPYYKDSSSPTSPSPPPPPPSSSSSYDMPSDNYQSRDNVEEPQVPRGPKNKYGDVWSQ